MYLSVVNKAINSRVGNRRIFVEAQPIWPIKEGSPGSASNGKISVRSFPEKKTRKEFHHRQICIEEGAIVYSVLRSSVNLPD